MRWEGGEEKGSYGNGGEEVRRGERYLTLEEDTEVDRLRSNLGSTCLLLLGRFLFLGLVPGLFPFLVIATVGLCLYARSKKD